MDCGYEGGDGHARARETAFAERVASMPPQQRFELATKSLHAARSTATAAVGTFGGALSDSRMDLLGSANANEDKANTLSRAYSEVMESQDCVRKAAAYLDDAILQQLGIRGPELNFTSTAFGLEHHYDSGLVDLLVHSRIRKAKKDTEIMLAAIDHAITKLAASPTYRGTSL